MALVTILLMAAWTLFLVRVFAIGATLSERTLLTYLALGALMALTAAPFAEKFIVPYPLREYGYNYLGALLPMTVRNLMLLAPVVTYLLVRRNHRLLSLADAFLLGFAIGFGYELAGALLLGASVATRPLAGVTLLPPWQMTWDNLPPAHFTGGIQQLVPVFAVFRVSSTFAIAGAAYSAGLVALVFVAVSRFWGKLSSAIVASAVLLLLLTAHEALWVNQFIAAGAQRPSVGLPWIFDLLLLHGKLIAPAALATLLYCTVREFAWVAAATGAAGSPRAILIDEFQNLIGVFRREGFASYRRASAESRLRRQIELAKAESQRAPADRELFQTVRLLEIKQNEDIAKRATGHRESGVIASVDMRIAWAAWCGLALIVVLIPWLPSWLPAYLWKFPLFNFSLFYFPLFLLTLTPVQVVLAVALLRWYLQGPVQLSAQWDAEETCRFHGQNVISYAAMGAALLVLFQVPLNNFYPPYSPVTFFNSVKFPAFDVSQIAVLILLLGLIASSLGLNASAQWRSAASAQERTSAVIRKSITLANAAIFMWISFKLYFPILASLQKNWGPTSFTVFGRFGNVVMALSTVLLVFIMSLAIGYGLRLASQRVESFLLRDDEDRVNNERAVTDWRRW